MDLPHPLTPRALLHGTGRGKVRQHRGRLLRRSFRRRTALHGEQPCEAELHRGLYHAQPQRPSLPVRPYLESLSHRVERAPQSRKRFEIKGDYIKKTSVEAPRRDDGEPRFCVTL